MGDLFYDQYGNKRYNTQGLFAKWKPQQAYLKGTEVNFTVDNLFNKYYILSGSQGDGWQNYWAGRGRMVSLTHTITF